MDTATAKMKKERKGKKNERKIKKAKRNVAKNKIKEENESRSRFSSANIYRFCTFFRGGDFQFCCRQSRFLSEKNTISM